jgi:hypothetical protein
VPEAEIPKEHLYAVDENHQIHDFQITCLTRFSLSDLSVGVRAVSQIATALAVRESSLSFSSIVTLIFLPLVLVYTRLRPNQSGGIQIAQPE